MPPTVSSRAIAASWGASCLDPIRRRTQVADMHIAFIGHGQVGGGLARRPQQAGHEVTVAWTDARFERVSKRLSSAGLDNREESSSPERGRALVPQGVGRLESTKGAEVRP
jgi:predicted dinucleotide-binding enzyme